MDLKTVKLNCLTLLPKKVEYPFNVSVKSLDMSCEWFSLKFSIFQGSVLILIYLYAEEFLILQEINGENFSERRQQHFSCHLFSSCNDEGISCLMTSRKQMFFVSDLMSQSNMASVLVLRGAL